MTAVRFASYLNKQRHTKSLMVAERKEWFSFAYSFKVKQGQIIAVLL